MKIDFGRLDAIARRWPAELRLVLLHGADGSASRDHADRLAAQFAGASIEELSGTRVAADPQALVAAATSMSMFGDATLVRIDGLDDAGVGAVEALIAGPPGHPVIALAGMLKKGSKLLTLCEGSPAVAALVSYEPSLANAGAIISEIAAPLGLRCGRDVAAALFTATAGNRQLLRQELGKLALYLDADPAQPQAVDAAAVAAVCVGVADVEMSDIAAAVTAGRPDVLVALLAEQAPGLAIPTLRAVERRLSLLLTLRAAVDAGQSADAAVGGARPPVFWKEKDATIRDLRAATTPLLAWAMAKVLAAERAIKSSGSAGERLADQALIAIARRCAQAARSRR